MPWAYSTRSPFQFAGTSISNREPGPVAPSKCACAYAVPVAPPKAAVSRTTRAIARQTVRESGIDGSSLSRIHGSGVRSTSPARPPGVAARGDEGKPAGGYKAHRAGLQRDSAGTANARMLGPDATATI